MVCAGTVRSNSAKVQCMSHYSERYCSAICHYIAGSDAWKNASGGLESPGIFCNQGSGNPGMTMVTVLGSSMAAIVSDGMSRFI